MTPLVGEGDAGRADASPGPRRSWWSGSRRECLGIAVVYLGLAILLTYPVVRFAGHAIPMDPQIEGWYPGDGDPWHYLWGSWYVARAFSTFPPRPFWTDLVFYPLGFEIPFLPGVGLILGPAAFLQAVLGVVLTYNLLWWLSFALAGSAMYLCGRRLLGDRGVAFVCGYLFAFSSFRMIHALEHLPILMASFLVPLFGLVLLDAGGRPTIRRYVLGAIVLAASAGISWYCTIALSLFLGLAGVVRVRERPLRALAREHLAPAAIGLAVFALAVAPLVLPLILSPSRESIISRPLGESSLHSADLLAFFLPSPRNPVLGRLTDAIYARFTGNPYEQTVYLGWVLLGLAAVGVVSAAREQTRLLRVAAATAFVLALGPFLHVAGQFKFPIEGETVAIPLPYLLLRHVPFVNGMRVPSRFTELLLFSLIVLAGYGLVRLCARLGRGRKASLLALVLVAATIETTMVPLPVVSARAPAVYAEIGRSPGPGTVLELPLDWQIIKYHYYQTIHHKRMVVGHPVRPREKYSTYPSGIPLIPFLKDPKSLVGQPDPPDARRDAERLADFFDIRHVVIHGEYLDPRAFERLDRFVGDNFPHTGRRIEGTVVSYALRPPGEARGLWPDRYFIDFGSPRRDFALLTGWSADERWGDAVQTMQWSNDRESSAMLFLPDAVDRVLEVRLRPLTYAGSPPQRVTVSVNGTPRTTFTLAPEWEVYRIVLPAAAFRGGLNTLTFTYAYAVAPARVLPGSADTRILGVAFDYLALTPRR
jgi:hypothetical protein